jgi:hypothetical protein
LCTSVKLSGCQGRVISKGDLRPGGDAIGLKPATLSFQNKKVQLEWPKRRMPQRRKVKGIPQRGEKEHEAEKECERQASWKECFRQKGSGSASLLNSVEEV